MAIAAVFSAIPIIAVGKDSPRAVVKVGSWTIRNDDALKRIWLARRRVRWAIEDQLPTSWKSISSLQLKVLSDLVVDFLERKEVGLSRLSGRRCARCNRDDNKWYQCGSKGPKRHREPANG